MIFVPLYAYLPKIAIAETRCLISINDPKLPPGEYGLVESFCEESGCDCRRVFLNIISEEQGGLQAVISFGWEDEVYYAKWMRNDDPKIIHELKGPSLNTLAPQSNLAPVLLEYVKEILEDSEYVERIKRHYWQFKEEIERKYSKKKKRNG